MTNKSAFTLIEVLIAITIIFLFVIETTNLNSQQKKIIAHALQRSQAGEKITLFIDKLKLEKNKKKIHFDTYLKNLKIDAKDKQNLNTTFIYTSFIDKTLKIDQNDSSFKVYKQNFTDDKGDSITYYRIKRGE